MSGATDLRADCARCFGLCCVAPAFAASADFAIDKPAGRPCPNLLADFRCGVHSELRQRGFPGCTVFDCFGAGQKVAQSTFGGQDWRRSPAVAADMFAAFGVMRALHELLWYLTEALALPPALPLHDDLRRALADTEHLTNSAPHALLTLDVNAHRQTVDPLLRRTSTLVRAGRPGRDLSRADLVGRNLRNADLRNANLRGALLIGANLHNADLRTTDLIGADLRAANLRGANLTTTLFLTQFQLNATTGDPTTRLPAALDRPPHWS